MPHDLVTALCLGKLTAGAILFGDKQCKKNAILRFYSVFSRRLVGIRYNMQE